VTPINPSIIVHRATRVACLCPCRMCETSPSIGRNALLCMRRYGVTLSAVLSARRIDEFISTEEITVEQERSADFFYRSALCCKTTFFHYSLITQELIAY